MPDLEITDADVQTFQAAHQRALVSDPSYRNADMAGLTAVAERALQEAADRAEVALKAESDRLAEPQTARAVELGIGAAVAINAVRRAILGDDPQENCPARMQATGLMRCQHHDDGIHRCTETGTHAGDHPCGRGAVFTLAAKRL